MKSRRNKFELTLCDQLDKNVLEFVSKKYGWEFKAEPKKTLGAAPEATTLRDTSRGTF